MDAVIVNFRQNRHTSSGNQMVIKVKGYSDKEKAKALVGKKVTWTTQKGNSISGKISGVHGNKGAVKAIFEKGMPGQSVGTKIAVE